MNYTDKPLAWYTDEDGDTSITSTSNCKRGKHSPPDKSQSAPSELVQQAVAELEQEAEAFALGANPRPLSMQLLADTRVKHWPMVDHVVEVNYRPGWTIKHWTSALRAEVIRITCGTVVIYFEQTLNYQQLLPLKNNQQSLCKVIRQHQRNARIFITNLLPQPSHGSPLEKPRQEKDFLLVQAIRSINRVLGKIHYMSTFEHFISSKGKIIRPTHLYFEGTQHLTVLGCLVLRECLLREAGLKSYWFQ